MKNMKILAILLVFSMVFTLVACSKNEVGAVEEEIAEPVTDITHTIQPTTPEPEPTNEPEPEPEPEVEEPEFEPISEYDLLPFVEFNDIIVLQRQDVADEDEVILGGWASAESQAITGEFAALFAQATEDAETAYEPFAYIGSQVVAGTNHCVLCTTETEDGETAYVVVYLYEDLEGNVEVTNTIDYNTATLSAGEVDGWNQMTFPDIPGIVYDPLGYLSTVRVYNSDVVVGGEFDDSQVDVTTVGDYEITFLLTVDRDAYDQAYADALAALEEEPAEEEGSEDSEEVDEALAEETDEEVVEEETEEKVIEHPQMVEITKIVRIVEEEDYNSMLEDGTIEEVISGTAILVLTEEERIEKTREESKTDEETSEEDREEGEDPAPVPDDNRDDAIAAMREEITSDPEVTPVPLTPTPNPTPNPDAPTGPQNTDPNTTPEPVNDDVDPTPAPNPDAPTGPQNTDPNTTPEPVKDDVDPTPAPATPAPATPKPTATPTPETPKPTATPTPETPKPTATPTPATPTPKPHTHSWVANTVHHDEVGHYETKQTGTKQVEKTRTYTDEVWVSKGWVEGYYVCNNCGRHFDTNAAAGEHQIVDDCFSSYSYVRGYDDGYWDEIEKTETYYEDEPVYEDVWVVDHAAYDETTSWTCSGCGETTYSKP